FPNKEVFRALIRLTFVKLFGFNIKLSDSSLNNLENGSNEDIKNEFISIIQTTPYDHNPIDKETILRLLVYMYFVGAGVNVRPEFPNLKGRSDLELEFENRRIVIEFKYADNENDAKEKLIQAKEQIKLRDYGNHKPSKECLVFALVYDGEKKEVKYFEYVPKD
ncbi:MAG: PD-(D/E)XK nuclease domain-containing protein, partial [Ruminobacter sp.]|nr:PD-(D/E)XK nuclease domain-containing protein [Ruminobacter sp.]